MPQLDQVRARAGREKAFIEGRHPGGVVPYGYQKDEDGVLEAREEEAAIVRNVFVMYRDKGSIEKVVEALNASGTRTRSGKEWSKAAVGWILRNPVHVGKKRMSGRLVRARHRGIVVPALYSLVQTMLNANRRGNRPKKAPFTERGPDRRAGTRRRLDRVEANERDWLARVRRKDGECSQGQ